MSKFPSPAEFKSLLLSIYPCKVPFEVLVLDKKLKTNRKTHKRTGGTYSPTTCTIRIYACEQSNDELRNTAIHEYAHHVHYTEQNKELQKEKPHGPEFWQIYGALMCVAAQKGVFIKKRVCAIARSIIKEE